MPVLGVRKYELIQTRASDAGLAGHRMFPIAAARRDRALLIRAAAGQEIDRVERETFIRAGLAAIA